jgi:polyhydroxyalkanoate synthesis regulator phasin
MFEIFEKIILAGVGFATMTKEKAENIVDSLIAKGQIKAKDKKAMVNRLLKHTRKLDKDIEARMKKISLDVVRGSQKQIDSINKKLHALSSQISKPKKKTAKKKKK